MPGINDKQILTKFSQGNHRAFEEIFKSNYQHITGFCIHFIKDRDEAKNIAQEAFIKLWLNREKIEKINGIKSFLYTSAKSDCLNLLRHKKVECKYQNIQLDLKENQINTEVLETFGFESIEYSEIEKHLNKCIEELPEKSRIVFIKSRFEDMKNREIAEEMNISVKSVEANMTRALRTLKLKLSEFLPLILIQFILYLI